MTTYKVAIVYGEYMTMMDEGDVVAKSITDWAEVSEEEYALLSSWVWRLNKQSESTDKKKRQLLVLEEAAFMPNTIAACKAEAKKAEEERLNIEKKKAKEKKLRGMLKSKKTKAEELQLLKDLHEKYGSEL